MASNDVWQAFIPKIRKGNYSSNLSQISSCSSTKIERLSLSCRVPTHNLFQAAGATTKSAVSSPTTPTSKRFPQKSTPPSKRNKLTPKNNSPADGLTQRKIDGYFSNNLKQPDTTKEEITIIELSSDSSEDDDSQPHYPVKSSVSRVLFPSTSLHNTCVETEQQNLNCEPELNIQNKENQNTFSHDRPKSPEEIVDPSAKGLFKLPTSFRYKVAARSNLKVNHAATIFDNTQDLLIQKDEIVTTTNKMHENVEIKSAPVNEAGCRQNSFAKKDLPSTRLPVDKNSESIALAVENLQGKEKVIRKGAIDIPCTNTSFLLKDNPEHISKKHTSSKDNLSGSTPHISFYNSHHDDVGVSSLQSQNAEKCSVNNTFENFTGVTECVSVESSGDLWTPRHSSHHTSSSSDDFDKEMHTTKKKRWKKERGQKIKNDNQKKNVKISRNDKHGNRNVSDRGKGEVSISTKRALPTTNNNANKKKAKINLVKDKKNTSKVEHVDDREKPCTSKTCLDGKLDTRSNEKINNDKHANRNVSDKGKREVSVSTKRALPTTNNKADKKKAEINLVKDKKKTSKVEHVDDGEKPCTSKTCLDSNLDTESDEKDNSEKEDFAHSGGFYPDTDELETYVRNPSAEYLEEWQDLTGKSFATVERESADSGTEKSSIVADISAIDEICDELTQVAKSHVSAYNKDWENDMHSTHSASTVVAPKKSNQTLDYQSNLAGVSLTISQWNELPTQPGATENNENDLDDDPTMDRLTVGSSDTFYEVIGASFEGNVERSTVPHEVEDAPSDGDVNVRGSHKANQPDTSPEKEITRVCSNSDASFTSEIISLPCEQALNKKGSSEEVNSSERVLEWVSHIHRKKFADETRAEESSDKSRGCSRLQKLESTKRNCLQTQEVMTDSRTVMQTSRNKCKPCNVVCQVKVFIKPNVTKDKLIKNVNRIKCSKKGVSPDKKAMCKRTRASLNVDIYESLDIQHTDLNLKSKQRNGNTEAKKHNSLQHSEGNTEECSVSSQRFTRRPVKVEVKFGKWGWEELQIDCFQEGMKNDNYSASSCSIEEDIHRVLSIQEVDIKLCNCSRSMQIVCIINKEKMLETESDSICRSRYHTSLKEYASCWGFPENPLNLSMIAYSEFIPALLEDSNIYSLPFSEKDTLILDSSCQDSGQRFVDSNEGENFNSSNLEQTASRQSQQEKQSTDESQKTWETHLHELGSSEDTSATPPGLSDDFQEWMTPPLGQEEVPKQDSASQWKTLMLKMRSGGNTSKNTRSITSSSSSLSSVSSVTSRETWTRGRGWGRMGYSEERKSKTCPFHKKIEGTKFAVDAFSYGPIPGITHYFLSHFHYDHYIGLHKKFSHPIYCSSVTAKLVALKIKVDQSLLNRLDPGQTVTIDKTKVTALDANHCPGSVMLLFELPDGKTHLHVGDFRAHSCMESYHALWNVDIDRLYLDTTYCDPLYTFPPQPEIIGNILYIVDEAMNKEPKTLIVSGAYTIGKERVFAAIAEKLKTKIWAPSDKLKVLQCVKEGLQDLSSYNNIEVEGGAGRELGLAQALKLLTKEKENAQVHVLPMAKIKRQCLEEHLYSIKGTNFTNVIAFRPTGWAHGRSGETKLVCNSPVVKIYEMAYSEHSNFLEMARFVKFIRPNQVIKTVNVGSPQKRQAMDKHINSWLAEVKSKIPIPNKQNDSPKTSRVTEEQKKTGIFQVKNGSKSFEAKTKELSNSLISEIFSGERGESAHHSLERTIMSTQPLLYEKQRRTESFGLVPSVAFKREHSSASENPRKKRKS